MKKNFNYLWKKHKLRNREKFLPKYFEKGKCSNKKKEKVPIRKKENVPFKKKEYCPIRKGIIFHWEMAEGEQEDKTKRNVKARGQKDSLRPNSSFTRLQLVQ